MNDSVYNRLREERWRRKLTPAEEAELSAWLSEHPEVRKDWEAEAGLTEILGRLPNAPVSSNFTARVLEAVERETRTRPPAHNWKWIVRSLLPKVAVASVLLTAALVTYHGRVTAWRRVDMAQNAATFSRISSLPPDVWQDFDAIQLRMNSDSPADEELIAIGSYLQ